MRWWLVAAGCFAVVVLGGYPGLPPGVRNWDTLVKLHVANNFLHGQGFVITQPTPDDPTYVRPGRGGRNFSMYPPLAYVQQFPVLALAALTGTPVEGVAPLILLGFAAVMMVAWGRRNGAGAPAAAAAAMGVCFGTALWASVAHSYDVLVEVFALTVVLWAGAGGGRARDQAAAGLAVGAALATRIGAVLLLAPAAATLLQAPRKELWRRGALFAAGCAPGVLLILGFNWYRFDSPFAFSNGSHVAGEMVTVVAPWLSVSHLEGMAGLLVSPGKGVIWYGPPLLGVLICLRPLLRRYRPAYVALGVYLAASVVLLGRLSFWAGEWAWGPRYVAPLYVAAAPLVWWLWELGEKLRRPARLAACVGAVLLIAVQALPVVGYPIENHLRTTMRQLKEQGALVTSPITRPPVAEDNRVLYFSWQNSMMVSLGRAVVLKLSIEAERAKFLPMLGRALLVPALAAAWVAALALWPSGERPPVSDPSPAATAAATRPRKGGRGRSRGR